ncbi:MAG: hypothetical protein ACREQB_01565 [Candidatus Binataceae bacterium]
MSIRSSNIIAAALALSVLTSGCGLFYHAGTRIRASYLTDSLKAGQSTVDVRNKWGEPDIRQYPDDRKQIWSYAYKPNSNDVLGVFYTSTISGDRGTFVDLEFVENRLVTWTEAEHVVPEKAGGGFSYGITGGSGSQGSAKY